MKSPRSRLRNTPGWIGATTAALVVLAGAAAGVAASPSDSSSPPPGSTQDAGLSSATDPHEEAAQHEVVQMLAAFQAPPGAARKTRQPDPLPAGLTRPPMKSAAVSQVAAVGWYETSQSPQEVLAWVKAHPPTGSSLTGWSGGPGGFSTETFAFPGRLNWLIVTPQSAADGRTIIRLDASDVWTPSRPPNTMLGYTATSVSVVTTSRANPQFPLPPDETATHTSTDPAVVHKVVDLLNALQPPVPGVKHCTADLGITVRITLPGEATVAAEGSGCGEVLITPQGGSPQYYDGAADLIPKVYTLFGVTWNRSADLRPGIERTGAAAGSR